MDNLAADFTIENNEPLTADFTIGGNSIACKFEINAAGTTWGSITGNINNQTDLINLLNEKVDLTSFEELSQTVTNNYNELSGNITNLTTTVTDNYNTLSGQISDLTGVVNDNYTSLDNRLTTAEGSILDLTDTVNDNYTELDGKITTTNNNLSTLSQTVEDNNTAINNRVDGIVESFDGDISDLNNAVDNLSDTVTNNYTDLNGRITVNTDNIATIQNTINSYGDIVSYNAAYFATANQGALADTALQPNDNISELVNDVGYITSASLPTVNNATITIQKNGADVGTFTLNQANNDTLNIIVPTQASDIGAMPDTTTIEDLTTTAQLNALNSGATSVKINQIATNTSNIASINNTISGFGNIVTHNVSEFATSAQGLLANTALQPNDNISELTNDVGYITSASLPTVNNGTLDIQVNGTSIGTFTANQSGNTTANIVVPDSATWGNITGTLSDQTDLQTALNGKQATLVSGTNIKTINSTSLLGSGNIAVQPTLVSGTNIKTINSTSLLGSGNIAVQPTLVSGTNIKTLNNTSLLGSGNISVQPTITSSAKLSSDLVDDTNHTHKFATAAQLTLIGTALQPNDNITELVNNAGYITSSALTPYVLSSSLATVATTGDYDDLTNKPTIPTVNNGTLTIQKNGTTIGTFTANQSGNSTINIEADTVLTDDITVSQNSDDELQTIGVIDDNTQNAYNFTVVGSPTITDDGIASGFSGTVGAKAGVKVLPTLSSANNQIFVFEGDFNYISSSDTQPIFMFFPSASSTSRNMYLLTNSAKGIKTALFDLGYTETSNIFTTNGKYHIKYETDLSSYYKVYVNDILYNNSIFETTGTKTVEKITLGYSDTTQTVTSWKGSIDLKQFSITVDGVEVYRAWQPPALKYWTGTLAEYNAITTKDPNTIYNITDDNTADAYEAYTKSQVNALIQDALYYKSGDTFEGSIHCVYPAFVTGSGTSVRIGITTPKRLDNITSVTCNSLVVNFRKSTGGYAPSGSWNAKANATSITCEIGASNLMYVWVNYDDYGLTNNTPVGCETESFSFTFT